MVNRIITPGGPSGPSTGGGDPDPVDDLLDRYESAVRLSAFTQARELRAEVRQRMHREFQDGEFTLEGELFGARFASRAIIKPRMASSPEGLVGFLGELVQGLLHAVAERMDQLKRDQQG